MRRIKRAVSAAAMTAAAASAIGISARLSANTLTWTGTTRDPDSPSYTVTAQGGTAGFTNGMNLYLWNTSVANWTSGGAAVGPAYTGGMIGALFRLVFVNVLGNLWRLLAN